MKTGIELITEERQEQIVKHKRTIEHDAIENNDCQLVIAAIRLCQDLGDPKAPEGWSLTIWRKMTAKHKKDRLIIAGALIAAEIDMLQYSEE